MKWMVRDDAKYGEVRATESNGYTAFIYGITNPAVYLADPIGNFQKCVKSFDTVNSAKTFVSGVVFNAN